jgi:ribosomal protein L21E
MKIHHLLASTIIAASVLAVAPASARDFASSSFGGRTTTVLRNTDGSHTVSIAEKGATRTELHGPVPAGISVDDGNGGWKPYAPPVKSKLGGSGTYGGVTTIVEKNDDGTHTVTVRDGAGNTSSEIHGAAPAGTSSISVDDGKGGLKPYTPPAKSKVIASTTYEGKTTTVTRNDDGSHTVTVVDENGKTSSEIHPLVP